jgi:hypothetical protein
MRSMREQVSAIAGLTSDAYGAKYAGLIQEYYLHLLRIGQSTGQLAWRSLSQNYGRMWMKRAMLLLSSLLSLVLSVTIMPRK